MHKKSSKNNSYSATGGVLLVDKPEGWTSHDVVKFVRGFGINKVGHCGTLDPLASGLLVLVLNEATKLTGQFNIQDKNYQGEMLLGIETSTQDADGTIVQKKDWSSVTEKLIRETIARFTGPQDQIPPMVSAKKIGGKRLYKLARQGIVVERKPVPVTIYSLALKKIDLPVISFSVKCSKGTYVRTLCSDIGTHIGCGAHLKSLRRIESGCFKLSESHSMIELKSWNRDRLLENCIPTDSALSYI